MLNRQKMSSKQTNSFVRSFISSGGQVLFLFVLSSSIESIEVNIGWQKNGKFEAENPVFFFSFKVTAIVDSGLRQ